MRASHTNVGRKPPTLNDVFFSITKLGVAKQKRAVAGNLVSSDVGMSLHRALATHSSGSADQIVVSVEPINTQLAIMGGEDLRDMALVLSPSIMELEELCSVRAWEVSAELWYAFDHLVEPRIPSPKVCTRGGD